MVQNLLLFQIGMKSKSILPYSVQATILDLLEFQGVSLHSGTITTLGLHPAPPNSGIVFQRIDLPGQPKIPAHYSNVCSTQMATSIGLPDSTARVGTVEHLMSALYGLGVSNVLVKVGGAELPILDGSALPFVEAILKIGIQLQPFSRSILRIRKPIKIYHNDTICELLPRANLRLTTSVDFSHPLIGLQIFALELSPEEFVTAVAGARTFGFVEDLEGLKRANLALGASLENVLAFSANGILNSDGPRFPDECVRHKLLDTIGDLALCGHWIEGELVSYRGGHSIHSKLLNALSDFPHHWELIAPEKLYRSPIFKTVPSFDNPVLTPA